MCEYDGWSDAMVAQLREIEHDRLRAENDQLSHALRTILVAHGGSMSVSAEHAHLPDWATKLGIFMELDDHEFSLWIGDESGPGTDEGDIQ